ncbi:hypothetical protein [Massilia aquatica]|uniref:hypothetical protein n=1 Tax=Massilia aquatica TaxID=2609000 RepID=UPI001424246B|nr:hypothetical protein [Massilia aquatica]
MTFISKSYHRRWQQILPASINSYPPEQCGPAADRHMIRKYGGANEAHIGQAQFINMCTKANHVVTQSGTPGYKNDLVCAGPGMPNPDFM